jgi:hypothetical protein
MQRRVGIHRLSPPPSEFSPLSLASSLDNLSGISVRILRAIVSHTRPIFFTIFFRSPGRFSRREPVRALSMLYPENNAV